jgi:hypothetical protein
MAIHHPYVKTQQAVTILPLPPSSLVMTYIMMYVQYHQCLFIYVYLSSWLVFLVTYHDDTIMIPIIICTLAL